MSGRDRRRLSGNSASFRSGAPGWRELAEEKLPQTILLNAMHSKNNWRTSTDSISVTLSVLYLSGENVRGIEHNIVQQCSGNSLQ